MHKLTPVFECLLSLKKSTFLHWRFTSFNYKQDLQGKAEFHRMSTYMLMPDSRSQQTQLQSLTRALEKKQTVGMEIKKPL